MKIEAYNTSLESIQKLLLQNNVIQCIEDWDTVNDLSSLRFKSPFIDYEDNLVKFVGKGKKGDILYLSREGDIVFCHNLNYSSLVYRMKYFNKHRDRFTSVTHSIDELMAKIDERLEQQKVPYKLTFNKVGNKIQCILNSNIEEAKAESVIHTWLQRLANRKIFKDNLTFWF